MPEYPPLSSRDVERILHKRGFKLSRQRGRHQQFVGYTKGRKRRVTVLSHQKDFAPGTIRSMIQQSGLTREEWYRTLRKK
jgi:predicted RNA binding protein YcfA (HicA-like mRNA interferase family)